MNSKKNNGINDIDSQYLLKLLDQNPLQVAVINLEGELGYFNDKFKNLFIDQLPSLGNPISDVLIKNQNSSLIKALKYLDQSSDNQPIEEVIELSINSVLYKVRISPLQLKEQKLFSLFFSKVPSILVSPNSQISKDISELLDASQIFNGMTEGVILLESNGDIFVMNSIFKNWLDDKYGNKILEHIKNNPDLEQDSVIEIGDSELTDSKHFEVHKMLYQHNNGSKDIWFIKDISEIINYKNDLSSHKDQLEQSFKFAAMGEMSSSIVHEIKSPVTLIMGYNSKIKTELKKPDINLLKIKEYSDKVDKGVERINETIRSMLHLTRNNNRDPMISTPLNEVLKDVKMYIDMDTSNPQIPVTYHMEEDDISLECYSSEITQVVINLIRNAKDAIAPQENPWVKIFAKKLSQEIVQIKIVDSGNGIPENIRDKIFDSFYTTKEKDKGTGIGLSLSKKLIEIRHLGKLYIDSNEPNTTFIIEIPSLVNSDMKSA